MNYFYGTMKNNITKQRLTKQRFLEMVSQIAAETGDTKLEAARKLSHLLDQKLEKYKKENSDFKTRPTMSSSQE